MLNDFNLLDPSGEATLTHIRGYRYLQVAQKWNRSCGLKLKCCGVEALLLNQRLVLDPMLLSDLKRFSDSNIRTSKLSTYVNFPVKELDLREFASESGGELFF